MLYFSEASKSRMRYVFKYVFWRCFNPYKYSCSYKYITRERIPLAHVPDSPLPLIHCSSAVNGSCPIEPCAMGAFRLTTVPIDHSQSQQSVLRGFPLFKRCEWLVVNRDVVKQTSPVCYRNSLSLDTSIPSEKDLEKIKQLNLTDEEKEQRIGEPFDTWSKSKHIRIFSKKAISRNNN